MADTKNLDTLCKYLYGIFAATMVMQMVNMTTMVPGMIAMLIALVITYSRREAAKGTPYESHLQWMIRTFWIGGCLYLPVATVIASVVIQANIDMNALMDAMYAGQIDEPDDVMELLMRDNKPLIIGVGLATMGPFLLWWLWRCWKGFAALKAGKPVDNVTSWV